MAETYEIDGVPATTAPIDINASLTVGSSTINKRWSTKGALTSVLTLEAPVTNSSGEVKLLTDGTLSVKVIAPNDGVIHSVTFRLVYKSPFMAAWMNLIVQAYPQEAALTVQSLFSG